MSSRLARQSLDLLIKTNDKNKVEKNTINKKNTIKSLPKTKTGLKKIKYEIQYGRHQKLKLEREEQKKKENPIVELANNEEIAKETLQKNIKLLSTRFSSSSTEKEIHEKILKKHNKKR
ncbi:hypothetical protein BJ944DRAFT_242002 [Cunninghamella echinulata]|nr:hypothetical protein BJ944DRAFT_242002 [Cunninghamella echinulata]